MNDQTALEQQLKQNKKLEEEIEFTQKIMLASEASRDLIKYATETADPLRDPPQGEDTNPFRVDKKAGGCYIL